MKKLFTVFTILALGVACSNTQKDIGYYANNIDKLSNNEIKERFSKFKDHIVLGEFFKFETQIKTFENKLDGNTQLVVYKTLIDGQEYIVNKTTSFNYSKMVDNKVINFQNDGAFFQITYQIAVLPTIHTDNILKGMLVFLDKDNRVVQIENNLGGKVVAKHKTKTILVVAKTLSDNFKIGEIVSFIQ